MEQMFADGGCPVDLGVGDALGAAVEFNAGDVATVTKYGVGNTSRRY